MSGICNKFLVFDLRVLVLACLTNSSLKYREGTSLHAFESQNQNLELNPFPDGQLVEIFARICGVPITNTSVLVAFNFSLF